MLIILNTPQTAVLGYFCYAFELYRNACKGWDGFRGAGEG